MAKRKKSPVERKELKEKAKTQALIRQYAKYCYGLARIEEAKKNGGVPIDTIVTKKGVRHMDVERFAEAKLTQWFWSLPKSHQARAKAKFMAEMGLV